MKYLKTYKVFENLSRFLIQFDIVYDDLYEYLDKNGYDAAEEIEDYVTQLEKLYNKGGKVYRLIFLESEEDLDREDLGEHWVMNKSQFDRFFNTLGDNANQDSICYMITANIPPQFVDVEMSIYTFKELPYEGEINLIGTPDNYEVEIYKKWSDKYGWI